LRHTGYSEGVYTQMQSYAPMGWNPTIGAAGSPWTAGDPGMMPGLGGPMMYGPPPMMPGPIPMQGGMVWPGAHGDLDWPGLHAQAQLPDIHAMGVLPALQGMVGWPGMGARLMPQPE
jgi:hypothetical protein